MPGRGSAIFLHQQSGGATAGCVSLSGGDLVAVLRWLSPAGGVGIPQPQQSLMLRAVTRASTAQQLGAAEANTVPRVGYLVYRVERRLRARTTTLRTWCRR